MGDRTSTIEHFIEIHGTSMYICLLPQNHLFSQQVAIITMQLDHIAVHTTSLIRIEKGLEWEPGPRTSNNTFIIETHCKCLFFIEICCTSMYICLLPPNQLLYRYNYNAASPFSNTYTKLD